MLTNVPSAITFPESAELSWDTIKLIIQSQHNLAVIGITVLGVMAVLIAGASYFTNIYLVRRELKSTIESLRSEITTSAEEVFGSLSERVKDDMTKAKKEIEARVEQQAKFIDAERKRLHARDAEQEKGWPGAALWWSRAIKGYAESEEDPLLRLAVDKVNQNLQKVIDLGDKQREEIRSNLALIPRILFSEKEDIEARLNELTKKESETT